MLEFFLVIFAAAVQSAGTGTTTASAAVAAPQPAVSAPAAQAEAAPSFLAPAGDDKAEAAPVFLTPGAGAGAAAASEAPPVFLAPKTAEAPPAFLAPAASAPALVAEPQVPTGKFTTATEVKPIMSATKANWIAVREYAGQDYLYVTQIWSWRCGMVQLRIGINGGPLEVWPLPSCHEDQAMPNAIVEGDGNPMRAFPPGSVNTVQVEITYDDLSTETARFSRTSVLMP